MPAPHRHGKSKAMEIGSSRSTENSSENFEINQTLRDRTQFWVNKLKNCENTHIGSYELKSQILVELITAVKAGEELQEVAEAVVRSTPMKISLEMAMKKLGLKGAD